MDDATFCAVMRRCLLGLAATAAETERRHLLGMAAAIDARFGSAPQTYSGNKPPCYDAAVERHTTVTAGKG